MVVTLSKKGQITIPLAVRRRLGLKPGMRLAFDETVPYVKAVREVNIEQMRSTLGCLRTDGTPEAQQVDQRQMMEQVRGSIDV